MDLFIKLIVCDICEDQWEVSSGDRSCGDCGEDYGGCVGEGEGHNEVLS